MSFRILNLWSWGWIFHTNLVLRLLLLLKLAWGLDLFEAIFQPSLLLLANLCHLCSIGLLACPQLTEVLSFLKNYFLIIDLCFLLCLHVIDYDARMAPIQWHVAPR